MNFRNYLSHKDSVKQIEKENMEKVNPKNNKEGKVIDTRQSTIGVHIGHSDSPMVRWKVKFDDGKEVWVNSKTGTSSPKIGDRVIVRVFKDNYTILDKKKRE